MKSGIRNNWNILVCGKNVETIIHVSHTDTNCLNISRLVYFNDCMKESYIDGKINCNNGDYMNPSQKLVQAKGTLLDKLESFLFFQLLDLRIIFQNTDYI